MKTVSIYLFAIALFLSTSCTDPKSDSLTFPDAPDSSKSVDTAIINKFNSADAEYQAMRQVNMTHTHGKDLAVNAHQDIPKKRRMMKRARELAPKKRLAYKRAQQRRKEALLAEEKYREKFRDLEN